MRRERPLCSSSFFFFPYTAKNGVVLATENKQKSILYEEHSIFKVEPITDHIGMVYSGECRIVSFNFVWRKIEIELICGDAL